MVSVSIIIISFNTREMTLECLRTLYSDQPSAATEVIVVDNASSDGSAAAIREGFPDVRLIENTRNCGFGPANNQAFRIARGDYLLLLNSDAFPRPGAIDRLVAYLDQHPTSAVVGPRILNRDGSLQRSCYRFPGPLRIACESLLLTAAFPNNRVVGDYRSWAHDRDRDVEFLIGACMLVRRLAIDEVGTFDEAFVFYAEETDWCRRFRRAGWKVSFTPSAEVYHLNGASGKGFREAVFNEFRRGQERYMRKHYGPAGVGFHRMMIVVGSCLRIVMFSVLFICHYPRRARYRELLGEWARILTWTVGRRGPGLGIAPDQPPVTAAAMTRPSDPPHPRTA